MYTKVAIYDPKVYDTLNAMYMDLKSHIDSVRDEGTQLYGEALATMCVPNLSPDEIAEQIVYPEQDEKLAYYAAYLVYIHGVLEYLDAFKSDKNSNPTGNMARNPLLLPEAQRDTPLSLRKMTNFL